MISVCVCVGWRFVVTVHCVDVSVERIKIMKMLTTFFLQNYNDVVVRNDFLKYFYFHIISPFFVQTGRIVAHMHHTQTHKYANTIAL